MGQNLTQEAKNVTDILNETTTKISNKATQYADQNCVAVQNLRVDIGGSFLDRSGNPIPNAKPCFVKIKEGVDIDLSINQACKLDSQFTVDNQSQILNDFQTNVAQSLDAAQKASSELFSILNSSQELKANYVNAVSISNIINNNVSNTFEQTCKNAVTASQDGYVTICGTIDKKINIKANIDQLGVASCIGDFRSNVLSNSSIINDVDQKLKARQEAIEKGLNDLVKSIAIIVGVLVVGAIVVGIILLLVSKPSSSPSSGGGAGTGSAKAGGSGPAKAGGSPQQLMSMLGGGGGGSGLDIKQLSKVAELL